MADNNILPKYFFIHTKGKIKNNDGESRYPLSSTSDDRDGDDMAMEFLEIFKEQINGGHVSFWTDHGFGPNGYYSALDKLGSWNDAIIENNVVYAKLTLRDKPVTPDLEMVIDILDNNIAVTFSVGFIPGELEEKENGGFSFKTGDLLEGSLVGIPSNPDATAGLTRMKSYVAAYQSFLSKSNKQIEDDSMTDEQLKKENDELKAKLAALEKQEGEDEEDDEDKTLVTLDAIKGIITDALKELPLKDALKSALKEIKEEDEDEEEEQTEGEDEEDDEDKDKTSPKPKGNGATQEGSTPTDEVQIFKRVN